MSPLQLVSTFTINWNVSPVPHGHWQKPDRVSIWDRSLTCIAVGDVGGIVGTVVSSIFLFLIAIINIVFLVKAVNERKRLRSGYADHDDGHEQSSVQGGGLLVRIIGPVLKTVDRPWKLYPVGLLFGLGESCLDFWRTGISLMGYGIGFDTASSIALLAISALAQRDSNGESINRARIVILPVRTSFYSTNPNHTRPSKETPG